MCPPCATAPRGRARWSRLRRFAVGAHGARPFKAKPAPRARRSCSLKGNPRARFPWPAASNLRPRAPRAKTRASSRSSASSVRPSPFPRSCHGSCGATSAPAPALRAFTIADVDTTARPDPAACPPLAENARNLDFAAVVVEYACPPLEGRATFAQDGRSRRGPCPDIRLRQAFGGTSLGKSDRLRAGKHRAGRTRHAACEALRLSHGGGGPLFPAAAQRKWGRRQKKA